MRSASPRRRSLAPFLLGISVYGLSPAQAAFGAVVRFVHGVPGAGTGSVEVLTAGKKVQAGSIRFGTATKFATVRSGSFRWRLVIGGKTVASSTATVGSGAYTAVLLLRNGVPALDLVKDQAGTPGKSLIRVLHAAPEFGSPVLKFDGKVVAPRLDYMAATPYLTVAPGPHTFAAARTATAAPDLSGKVQLHSDVAYTAIVVGTRGQAVRVVTLTDAGAPSGHPAASQPKPARPKAGPAPAAAQPGASSRASSGTVVVRPGDSLWRIAAGHLDRGATSADVQRLVVKIWNANTRRIGTGDPNLIYPGQRLRLPA